MQNYVAINGQILRKNIAIWSHCSRHRRKGAAAAVNELFVKFISDCFSNKIDPLICDRNFAFTLETGVSVVRTSLCDIDI